MAGAYLSVRTTRGVGWICPPKCYKGFSKYYGTLECLVVRIHRGSKERTGLDDIGNEENVTVANVTNALDWTQSMRDGECNRQNRRKTLGEVDPQMNDTRHCVNKSHQIWKATQ